MTEAIKQKRPSRKGQNVPCTVFLPKSVAAKFELVWQAKDYATRSEAMRVILTDYINKQYRELGLGQESA